jgi:hypothetical protein
MKKYILILLLTVAGYGQTLQNPTFGNTTTNTLKIKTPSTVTSVNFLPAFDADGITVSKIDPVNLIGLNNVDVVYVESNGNNTTAQIGNNKKAFLTIDAALDALPSTGGIVKIGIGSFLSPVKAKIKSNVAFIGSGKPITNSIITYTSVGVKPTITSPTKLVGGTILLGIFDGSLKDGIQLHDLGVDSGLDYCNAYAAGVAQEAVFFGQLYNLAGGLPSQDGLHQLQSNSPPRTGIVISNVSALCKGATDPVHAMLVENTINAKVSNVSTYYGTHGLVIKSIGCTVNGLDAHGHASNGLIFKANDYAYGQGNSVSNFYITSIGTNDGGGVNYVSENSTTCLFNNLSNGTIEYTTYGIANTGIVQGNNISNVDIYKTQGIGIDLDINFLYSNLSNIEQRQGTTGFKTYQDFTSTRPDINLVNCRSYENSSFGFDMSALNASSINLYNCVSDNPSGSTIVGNVYGQFKEKGIGSQTGTLLFNNSTSTDFISSIDSKGSLNKSLTKISNTGAIETPESLVIKGSLKDLVFDSPSTANTGGLTHKVAGVNHWVLSEGAGDGSSNFNLYNYGGAGGGTTGISASFNKLTGYFRVLNMSVANIGTYANDAAADADAGLPSGGFYKITGSRTIYQKP